MKMIANSKSVGANFSIVLGLDIQKTLVYAGSSKRFRALDALKTPFITDNPIKMTKV